MALTNTRINMLYGNGTTTFLCTTEAHASKLFADNILNGAKMKDASVHGGKLIDNTLDGVKIKDASIANGKIIDSTIELAKLAEGSKLLKNDRNDNAVTAQYDFTAGGITINSTGKLQVSYAVAPVNDADVVNKGYIDTLVNGIYDTMAGFQQKDPVDAATTAALPECTYVTGVLTASANGAFPAVDTVAAVANAAYLIKDQANAAHNGVYTLTTLGDASNPWVLTRRYDMDGTPTNEVKQGATVFVREGAVNGKIAFSLSNTNAPDKNAIVVGTDTMSFTELFSVGETNAGAGLSKNGNVMNIDLDGTPGLEFSGTGAASQLKAKINGTKGMAISADGIEMKIDSATLDFDTVSGVLKVKPSGASGLVDGSVTAAKLNEDVYGAGLVQNVTTKAIDVNPGAGIAIASDKVIVKLLENGGLVANLGAGADELGVVTDELSVEVNTGGAIQIKADGVNKSHLNADVIGVSGGLAQNADGSLKIDPNTIITSFYERMHDAGTRGSWDDDGVTRVQFTTDILVANFINGSETVMIDGTAMTPGASEDYILDIAGTYVIIKFKRDAGDPPAEAKVKISYFKK